MKVKCTYNCADTLMQKYIQKQVIEPEKIKVILISEALPYDKDQYFDSPGVPQYILNTNVIFNKLGYKYNNYQDYLNHGIYLTTALKCSKKGYLVTSETILNCSFILEKEIEPFVNTKAILLMGDFAIKSINYIWKRKYNQKIIPTGSTYKIRNGTYTSKNIHFFPSYTQTGDSFGLEKTKVVMIEEDIKRALEIK
jgi:uracil-DNA glycosylase